MKDSVKDEPIEQTEMSQMKTSTISKTMHFEISGDTLRDLFAAHALNGIVSRPDLHSHPTLLDHESFTLYAAKKAYVYADAMLKERGK